MPSPQSCIGEIQLWPLSFAPRNWAFCWGQTLSISQYSAVYSLLQTTYGGDGRTTFRLPDLRGRFPIGVGSGTFLGEIGGNFQTFLQTVSVEATTEPPTQNVLATPPTLNFSSLPPYLAVNYIICLSGIFPTPS